MKKTIIYFALIGLGVLSIVNDITLGGLFAGIGSAGLIFQVMEKALEG